MKRYTHDMDVVFAIESDKETYEDLTVDEIIEALVRRVQDLRNHPDIEAFCHVQTIDNVDGTYCQIAGED